MPRGRGALKIGGQAGVVSVPPPPSPQDIGDWIGRVLELWGILLPMSGRVGMGRPARGEVYEAG